MPILLRRHPVCPAPACPPEVGPDALMEIVRDLSFPRNRFAQPDENERAAEYVRARLRDDGREVFDQSPHKNVVALPDTDRPIVLLGAHYDSVDGTPGADDNASAIAGLLGVSRALARLAPNAPVGFVAFNEEEDGIVGSADFASWWKGAPRPPLVCAHVLEMIGYCRHEPGSQEIPHGPWRFLHPPDVGDFIGVLGNRVSARTMKTVGRVARRGTAVKVMAARVLLGLERRLEHLDLSDHVRFWEAGLPSVLWTDTAFYRNPNYHLDSDTPDTLDPAFLSGVVHLVLRVVAHEAGVRL